jgi:hypothetical protein
VAGVAADDDLDGGVVVDFAFEGFLGQVAVSFSDDQDEPFDGADAGEGAQAPGEDAAAGEREEDLALCCAEPCAITRGKYDRGCPRLINAIGIIDGCLPCGRLFLSSMGTDPGVRVPVASTCSG